MSSSEYLQSIYPKAQFESHNMDAEYGIEIFHMKDETSGTQLIFTEGCARREQEVNGEENLDLKHIELYIHLPDYINIKLVNWPIDWMSRIARVPQKNKTWFGYGDTLPAGNPPENITNDFQANHFILSKPIGLSETLKQTISFKFLAIIPIFQTEFDYKMRNSHTVLFEKMEKKGVTELIDLYRSSTCRKRLLGMF